jgi:hypothetical protein
MAALKYLTTSIYLSAAVAASFFWFSSNLEDGFWLRMLISWLLVLPALLFAFAYPQLLSDSPDRKPPAQYAVILHVFGALIATVLFVCLGSTDWKNSIGRIDSSLLRYLCIVAIPVLLVAAFALLFKNRPVLATFASFLFWPYWLVSALAFVTNYFEQSVFRAACCFLAFLASILFALAAGILPRRPSLAHFLALAGLIAAPWAYWSRIQGNIYINEWIMLNMPDDNPFSHHLHLALIASLTIVSVALVVIAISTAVLRLVPSPWKLHGLPLRDRTWPAFAACFVFLAVWFAQSVMPYRLPGAITPGVGATLQILHVEKHGLQLHETSIGISRDGRIYVSDIQRRLLQFRFKKTGSFGLVPPSLMAEIRTILNSDEYQDVHPQQITPIRSWNADNWYLRIEHSSETVYTSETSPAPPEIVKLFSELESLPRSPTTSTTFQDICLGFCYDARSSLGDLYANQRCYYEPNGGSHVICR